MIGKGVNLLLMVFFAIGGLLAQPQNDGCNSPLPLCPSVQINASNQGATATVCPDCEDDFTFCFSGDNTVWFTFETNTTGGDVTVDVSNLNFVIQANRGTQLQAVIVSATVPCDASSYTQVGNCEAGAAGNFSLNAVGLPPSTTYYVIINGAQNGGATLPAEADFDIVASGTGIDRVPAGLSITGPGLVCPELPVTFLANLSNCVDTSAFSWYINGNLAGVTTEGFWQTSSLEDGDVITLECSCFLDCPQDLLQQFGPVTVENLFVNAGPDQEILSGESVVLNGSTNGISYYWTPAANLSDPTSLTTFALPETTTTYFLTASSANCSLSDDVTITISDQLTIPGSFSPNDDGTNDTWVIKGIDAFPDAQVTIFDRWGQQIFEAVGYSAAKSWDGKHNGRNVTDGVYYYILDVRSDLYKEPFKGFVTVLR